MKKSNSRKAIIAYILLAVTVIVFYLANHYAHFEMDDLWYGTNLVTGEPLKSIGDIWQSQVWHYNNWGGRSMAHGLLQLTLLSGETVADILNVLVLAALVYAILKFADVQKEHMPLTALFVLGFLIVGNANWYQTLLWQSGVANYLYMTTLMLLFLWFVMGPVRTEEYKAPAGMALWIIPLGLICGWSNENMGPTVFLGSLAALWINYKKTGKLAIWQLTASLSSLAGCVLCITAPGNFVRLNDAANTGGEKGLLWRAFLRGYATADGLLYFLIIPIVVLALLWFVHFGLMHKKLRQTDILFLLMALASWGAMVLSPHYPDRAAFGTFIFILIPIVSMLRDMINEAFLVPAIAVWLGGVYRLSVYICQQIGWIQK